jgi:threonine dehydrogenase-like Zn-dependent dehydrogenase
MKAYRLISKGKMEFQEVLVPELSAGQALLKVLACGVCGTDIHLKQSGHYEWLGNAITLGHEVYAEVVELASHNLPNPQHIQIGDRVVIDPQIVCGWCRYCRMGRLNLCENLQHIGIAIDGGLQDYMAAPLTNLYRVQLEPEGDTPWYYPVLAEPVATCVAALKLARSNPEDSLLVVGLGFFGQAFLQIAKRWGIETVVGLDPLPGRREMALQLGATAVLDPASSDYEEALLDWTNGRAASIVIDAAGTPAAAAACVHLAGKTGRVIVFGYCPEPASLLWHEIMAKELQVTGSKSSNHAWEQSVQILEKGHLHLESLIQAYAFDRADEAFHAAETRAIYKPILILHGQIL